MNLTLYEVMGEDMNVTAKKLPGNQIQVTVKDERENVVFQEATHQFAWDALVKFSHEVIKVNEEMSQKLTN